MSMTRGSLLHQGLQYHISSSAIQLEPPHLHKLNIQGSAEQDGLDKHIRAYFAHADMVLNAQHKLM